MDAKAAELSELIEGIRAALQAERAGYEFYKMAAEHTEDSEGKKVFERLAGEEQEHFEFLSRHYKSLVERGQLAEGASLGKAHALSYEHPIFSAELKGRLRQAHFEMSALAIAAQLELNGINHYKSLARKATLPEAKRFFEELVVWETAHYDAFIKQQQELQEAYWAEAGFAPF